MQPHPLLPPALAQTTAAEPDLGEVLRRMDAGRTLGDAEIEQHIADLTLLWQRAYARFQAHASPADREEALLFLHMRDTAILDRAAVDRRPVFYWMGR
jgi:hypothetical protein